MTLIKCPFPSFPFSLTDLRYLTWSFCYFWFVFLILVAFEIGRGAANPNDEEERTDSKDGQPRPTSTRHGLWWNHRPAPRLSLLCSTSPLFYHIYTFDDIFCLMEMESSVRNRAARRIGSGATLSSKEVALITTKMIRHLSFWNSIDLMSIDHMLCR